LNLRIIVIGSLFVLLSSGVAHAGEVEFKGKCGFGTLTAPELHQGARRNLSVAGERPSREYAHLTSDGRFLIHYDLTGLNAIDPTVDPGTGLPVWIAETEKILTHAWHLLVDSLQFQPPPMDDVSYPEDPPQGAYDIYFTNFGYYGFTHPEQPVASTSDPDDYTGYLEFDNDFAGFPTEGLPALRVTVAHELFHLFQLGYAWKTENLHIQDLWWYELSSSWFEDVAYPAVNDYINYVENYFEDPRPLDKGGLQQLDGYRVAHYGYILSSYDYRPLWEAIWADFVREDAYHAIDTTLRHLLGSSFASSYRKFAGWNLLTGPNAVPGFGYPDAALYPEIRTEYTIVVPDSIPFEVTARPRTIRYYSLDRDPASLPYFKFLQLGDPAPEDMGGVVSLAKSAPDLHYLASNQTVDLVLDVSGNNGLMAVVNSGGADNTFLLQNSDQFLRPYPNPVVTAGQTGEVRLYTVLTRATSLEAKLYNLRGQCLYTYDFQGAVYQPGPQILPLAFGHPLLSSLSSGIYFIRLHGDSYNQTAKITILR